MLTMEEMQHQLNVLLAQQEQVANAAANGTGLVAPASLPAARMRVIACACVTAWLSGCVA